MRKYNLVMDTLLLSNDFVYNGFLNMEKGEINP